MVERNTHGNNIIILGAILVPLDILVVALRFWSRRIKHVNFRTCDWLILVALIGVLANYAVAIEFAVNGAFGMPLEEATMGEIITALKVFVAAPILWGFATCAIKLSVLFFYRDIFEMPRFRFLVHLCMALTACLMVAIILGTFLLCRPFAYSWDKTISGGHCGSSTNYYLGVGVLNMVIDFAIVALPMPILWRLQMSRGHKIAIMGILSLGLLVSIFSILRIVAIFDIEELNFTQTVVMDTIWGAMEIIVGVITACLPLLQPPLERTIGKDSLLRSLLRSRITSRGSGRSDSTPSLPNQTANKLGGESGSQSSQSHFELAHVAPEQPISENVVRYDHHTAV